MAPPFLFLGAAMVTVSDIISAAYRKIGVSGRGQDLSGEDAVIGLEVLNAMIHAWRLEGIDFSARASVLDDAYDWSATDDFPLPAAFREGVIYCLADRLAPEYSLPPSFDVMAFKSLLRTALLEIPTSSVDPALTWRNDRLRGGWL